jgi:hypothetical protein
MNPLCDKCRFYETTPLGMLPTPRCGLPGRQTAKTWCEGRFYVEKVSRFVLGAWERAEELNLPAEWFRLFGEPMPQPVATEKDDPDVTCSYGKGRSVDYCPDGTYLHVDGEGNLPKGWVPAGAYRGLGESYSVYG